MGAWANSCEAPPGDGCAARPLRDNVSVSRRSTLLLPIPTENMEMLFMAHSGLRYLVLLAGIAALVYFAYAGFANKGSQKAGRIMGSVFCGLLDLQIVLGILLVAMGLFYGALMGHLFMMIFAAVAAHAAMVFGRNQADESRGNKIRLMGVLLALVLIVGGIMAIGRDVFGSGSPTLLS
jgi:heme A synthase